MRIIGPLLPIATLVIFLVTLVLVAVTVFDVVSMCDDKNLQIREVIITNKFIENRGFHGDSYYFLDENGVDYQIWGGHEGARYVKLKLNQIYRINVNMEFGNVSCKEVLIADRF
jgi:hypothetical protein